MICIILNTITFSQNVILDKTTSTCYTQKVMTNLWEVNPYLKYDHIKEKVEFSEGIASCKSEYISHISYLIPIVVHVMHNNGPENISADQIFSQIEVLNEHFGNYQRNLNGIDTKIRFCLATKDPQGSLTTGINRIKYSNTNTFRVNIDDLSMKNMSKWDPYKYLNIWIINTIVDGNFSGYSYYPNGSAGLPYDGIVIKYDYFGRVGTLEEEGFAGSVTTHEVGHYLNLEHTWGDGDCSVDDGIFDTPNCNGPFYSAFPECPHPIQCGMIENFMDLSADRCKSMFTFQQALRMREAIIKYRASLVSADNLEFTGCTNSKAITNSNYNATLYVYPNPADDFLAIYIDIDPDSYNNLSITTYDIIGQRIKQINTGKLSQGPLLETLFGYAAGQYIIEVVANTGLIERKIFIKK